MPWREYDGELQALRGELWISAANVIADESQTMQAAYYVGRFDATLLNLQAIEGLLYEAGEIDVLEARSITLSTIVGRYRCRS